VRQVQREVQVIKETADYDDENSTETLDLYTVVFDDDTSIDFWFPKILDRPTSMDLHVVFARGNES